MAVVLKPFAHSADGFTVELLATGMEREFGAATDGLEAEGFIEVAKKKAAEMKPVQKEKLGE